MPAVGRRWLGARRERSRARSTALVGEVVDALRRHRHPREQRRRVAARRRDDAGGRVRGRRGRRTFDVNLTAHARLIRAVPAAPAAQRRGRVVNIASTEGLVATGGLRRVHGEQARRDRADAVAGRRARPHRRHRELRLPGPDPHRHDRRHPRRGQDEVRPPPGAAAPLRRARGGGADAPSASCCPAAAS